MKRCTAHMHETGALTCGVAELFLSALFECFIAARGVGTSGQSIIRV